MLEVGRINELQCSKEAHGYEGKVIQLKGRHGISCSSHQDLDQLTYVPNTIPQKLAKNFILSSTVKTKVLSYSLRATKKQSTSNRVLQIL